MKPEQTESKDEEPENSAPVAGDVIGDTAYSERFVLKILLKLANLDTLKHEIQEKSFEDDLCTLWDMTAERDVVLFLQKHNVLNLFNFALPVIESPRLMEIIIGIIGNMCCHKEVVTVLFKMDRFLSILMDQIKTDDSLILIQVLRLVSSILFLANDEDISTWMDLFKHNGYSTALYFILKNSSHKALLVSALENLNTVYSYCNTEKFRTDFFTHFVTIDALESLTAAYTELTVNQKELFEREEIDRILVICMQLLMTLVGFDKSPDIYSSNKDDITKIISHILTYYENKLVNQKEIDTDCVDIIDSANTILSVFRLSGTCDPDKYFTQGYSMWKAAKSISKSDQNGSDFEQDNKEGLQEFSKQMLAPLSTLICNYIENCSENNLLKILDEIGTNYDEILSSIEDEKLKTTVSKRAANYRTRLKENADS